MSSPTQLPQELIDLIIDEILHQTADKPVLRVEILRAIARVSKAFYFRARDELFSTVDFPRFRGERSTQTRAALLLETLEKNAASLRPIRTMRLVHDVCGREWMPSPEFTSPMTLNLSRFFETSRGTVTRLARQTGLQKDYLAALLQFMLKSTALASFALEVYSEGLSWESFEHHETSIILAGLLANPNIQSLKYANISDLPRSFLLGDFSSTQYRELVLDHVTLNLWERTSDEQYQIAARTAARIEVLTLWRLPYADLFSSLRTYLPQLPFGSRSQSPSIYFSNLKTLRVTIPSYRYDMEILWRFMLGVAGTLETLELRDFRDGMRSDELFRLSELTELKHLRVSGWMLKHVSETKTKLENMAKILNSATSQPKLDSITLELYMQLYDAKVVDLQSLAWAAVDEALLRQELAVELRNITLNIKIYYFDSSLAKTRYEDVYHPLGGADLLPRAAALPGVQFRCNVEVIYSPKPMTFHLGEF